MSAGVNGRKVSGEKSAKKANKSKGAATKNNRQGDPAAFGIIDEATTAQGAMRALEPRVLLDAAMDATFDAVDGLGNTSVTNQDRTEIAANEKSHKALLDALTSSTAVANPSLGDLKMVEHIGVPESAPLPFAGLIDENEDAPTELGVPNMQVVFVDSEVSDPQSLIAEFEPHVEVIFISPDSDGVEQMAAAVEGRSGIDAIHIISHGRSGTLDLGATKFTEASMKGRHADEMAIIAGALSENADILIYGCDFGAHARGASAVQYLAELTGADVAASEDLTGATALGGDWELEVRAGDIETVVIESTQFAGLLADTLGIADLVGGHNGVNASTVVGADGVTVSITTVSGDNLQNDGIGFGLGMGRQFTGVGVGSDYNINFSAPQASVSVLTSFHNSDGSGNEELRFVVRDSAGNDITSSVTITYNDQSTVGATAFGTSPYTGATALYSGSNANGVNSRGTITFTSATNEIADIEIEHFRTSGTPNGIIIEEIAYSTVVAAPNEAPIIDLNSDASDADLSRSNAATFTAGGGAVDVTAATAGVFDNEGDDYQLLTITPSGLVDGASEQIIVAGQTFTNGTDAVAVTASLSGANLEIDYVGGVVTVREASDGGLTEAQIEAVIQSVQYNNTSATPTLGARSIDFQVQQADGSFVIDFEEFDPNNDPTAAELEADFYWSAAAGTGNGDINNSTVDPTSGIAAAADGNYLQHYTNGVVPAGQQVVFGRSGIPVTPGTDYSVSVDLGAVNASGIPGLGPFQIIVDGNIIATIPNSAFTSANQFFTFTGTFTSSASTADFEIRNVSTSGVGNDFGIDNIVFTPTTPMVSNMATATVNVGLANTPPGIDLNGSTGAGADHTAVYFEDQPGVTLLETLTSGNTAGENIVDAEQNIVSATIVATLPATNDGAAERLVILGAGNTELYGVPLNGVAPQITTQFTYGSTLLVLDFQADTLTITKAGGGAIPNADLQSLLRDLRYVNDNQNNTTGDRTFAFTVMDADGVSAAATATVTVDRVNDSPVPTVVNSPNGTVVEAGTGTPAAIAVATGGDGAEFAVADLLAQLNIADAEQSAFGIGIVSADESGGVWQYKRPDIVGHDWTDFDDADPTNTNAAGVTSGEALLMDSAALLRFVPNTGFSGNPEIEFRIWDQSVGTASNPPSTITDDSGGTAPTATSSLSARSFAAGVATDTDGDGVTDDIDVDDDNDGILDSVEGTSSSSTGGTHVAILLDWSGSIDFSEGTAIADAVEDFLDDQIGSGNTVSLIGMSSGDANTRSDHVLNITFPTDGSDPTSAFDTYISSYRNKISLPNAFDFFLADYWGSALEVATGLGLGADDQVIIAADGFQGNTAIAAGHATTLENQGAHIFAVGVEDGGLNLAGTVAAIFDNVPGSSGGAIQEVTDYNTDFDSSEYDAVGSFTALGDALRTIGSVVTTTTAVDSDGDGIIDSLDLDSDNDGITDNIEAQATGAYVAPSSVGGTPGFTDINGDGLDDSYDARGVNGTGTLIATSAAATTGDGDGLTPVNTDGDADADYLDTDSDNEGGNDTAEAGFGTGPATGLSTAANDADGDGLFDVFESNGGINDGYNVNEQRATGALSLPDTDSDAAGGVPLSSDVDFRDASDDTPPAPDSDDDGVTDDLDIDDDNDGILDTTEGVLITASDFSAFASTSATVPPQDDPNNTVTGTVDGLNIIFSSTNTSLGGAGAVLQPLGTNGAGTAVQLGGFLENNTGDPGDVSRLTITFDQPIHSFSIDVGSVGDGEFLENFSVGPTSVTGLPFSGGVVGGTNAQPGGTITFDNLNGVTEISFDSRREAGGLGKLFTSFEVVAFRDSDSDGIFDHLDLDSDNDGITDNIEAQTTAGYIAPNADTNATYLSNDGLNSAYVPTNGLTPVNTDATDPSGLGITTDTIPDYLDQDSDGDGISDADEAGHGQASQFGVVSTAANDADRDGLFNVFETALDSNTNDGFVVNEGTTPTDGTYADTDGDVGGASLVADLDFRDASAPPTIDLDVADTGTTDTTQSFDVVTGDPILLAQTDAEGFDIDGTDVNSLTLTMGGFTDQGQESIIIDPNGINATIPYNPTAGAFNQNFFFNGVTYTAVVDWPNDQIVITRQDAADIPPADLNSLIRAVGYDNNAATNASTPRTIDFTLNDGSADSNTARATVNFISSNLPPVAVDDSITAIPGGPAVNLPVLGNDSDPDVGDTISVVEIIDLADPLNPITPVVGVQIMLTDGTIITPLLDGTIDVQVPVGSSGSGLFQYVIEDSNGARATANATVTILLDSDGDGVADVDDVDKDNDGILDVNEGVEAIAFSAATNGVSGSTSFGTQVDVTFSGVLPSINPGFSPSRDDRIDNDNFTFLSGADQLDDVSAFYFQTQLPNLDANNAQMSIGVSGTPVSELYLHVNSVDQFLLTFTPPPGIGVELLSGSNLEVVPNGLGGATVGVIDNANFDVSLADETQDGVGAGSADGTVRFYSLDGTPITNITLDVTRDPGAPTSGFSDGWQFAVEVARDTDGDGIADACDLDSDNDGIADNIEAQSTAGYIASSGTGAAMVDANNDGLDDNYDSRTVNGVLGATETAATAAVGQGLTPVNTDAGADAPDTIADYLDTDSDNDGIDDATEAGHGQSSQFGVGSTPANDADGDGLFDVFENAIDSNSNDGYIVNEGVANPAATGTTYLPDTDGDVATAVPLINDLDYRDASTPPVLNLDPNNDSGTPGDPSDDGADDGGFKTIYIENDPGVNIVDADFVISDAEDDIVEVVVTLTNGQSGDTFDFPTSLPGNVSAAVVPVATLTGPGVMTITFTGDATTTAADWTTILQSLVFTPSTDDVHNPNPADRNITIQASDSDMGMSATVETIVCVIPENDPPTLDLDDDNSSLINAGNYQGTYSENDPAVPISDGVVITDLDDTEMSGVTITLTNGEVGDLLEIGALPAGITLVGTPPVNLTAPGTITVELTGDGPIADYQAAIAAIGFSSNSENPVASTREIDVTVTDNNALGALPTPTRTAFITVQPVNDAPIPVDPTGDPETPSDAMPPQIGEDSDALTPFDVTPFFNDVDDPNTSLTFSLDPVTTPSWMSLDANGNIIGTPPSDASQNSNIGTPGTYEVTVIAQDPSGLTGQTTVVYTISNPEPVAIDDAFLADENGPDVTGNILNANPTTADSDPDGDTITVTQINGNPAFVGQQVSGSAGGLFRVFASGDFVFEDNGNFEDLAVGETRDTTITYTIDDGEGGTDTATVTVTVRGTNDGPTVVSPLPNQAYVDGEAISFPTAGAFDDVDTNDTFTYSATNLPAGLTIDSNTGVISGTIDNSASQSSGQSSVQGRYRIFVTVDDGNGGTVTDQVTFNISNPIPVATDDAVITDEDTDISFNAITDDNGGNGVDADTAPDSDDLTVAEVNGDPLLVGTGVAGSAGGTFTVNTDGSTTFEPGNDFQFLDDGETATTSVTYQVSDGEGGFDEATIEVTVNGSNDAPIPVDPLNPNGPTDPNAYIPGQSGTDGQDIPDYDVSSFFSDPDVNDQANLTYSISNTVPSWVSITSDGTIQTSGVPLDASQGGPNNDGIYPIEVTVTDGDLTFTTTVNYDFSNLPPVAVDDDYTLDEDTPLTVDAISGIIGNNDTDGDGDALSVTQLNGAPLVTGVPVTLASGAQLTLNADGSFTYDPLDAFNDLAVGETGTDSFDYQIGDGDGLFDTATVNFTINGVNDAPDAIDDSFNHTENGTPTTGNVLNDNGQGEDTDPDDSDVLTVVGVGAPTGGVSSPLAGTPGVTGGGEGLFTIDANGDLVFDDNGDFEYLALGETATTSITYTIDDGNGGTDTATVTVTVTGTNDTPIPVDPTDPNGPADPSAYIPEQSGVDGTPITDIDLTPFFDDPDSTDVLTLTINPNDLPDGLTFDGTTISGTPGPDASQNGDIGTPGTYTIPVTATDPEGASFTTNVTYVIGNQPPVAQDDDLTTDEDTVLNGSIFDDNGNGIDTDDPDGDVITVTQVGGLAANVGQPITGTNGGTFTINPNGTYSFNPGDDFNGLAVGETDTTSINYRISDGQGGFDIAVVTVLINGLNDAPEIIDPDDPGDPTNPNPADPTSVVEVQNVTDGQDFTTTPLIDLTDFTQDPDQTDDPQLVFTAIDPLPAGLTLNPDGTVTGTVDPSASQGGPNSDGIYPVEVTVTDPQGASATLTLTIDASNVDPVAVNDASSGTEDDVQTGNVITDPATGDADGAPDSDPVTVTEIEGQPVVPGTPTTVTLTNGTLEIDETGAWTFTPNGNANVLDDGETLQEVVTYQISDGEGGFDEATLTIDITGINDPVQIIDPNDPETDPEDPQYDPTDPKPIPDPLNLIPDEAYNDGDTITPIPAGDYFGDAEGDTITFSADVLPTGLTIDPNTGEITGAIDANASQEGNVTGSPGEYLVTITGTDPQGNTAETTVTLTISNLPVIAQDDDLLVDEDTVLIGNVITDDNDNGVDSDTAPDNDPLTVAEVNGVTADVGQPVDGDNGGIFTINQDGSFTFEPGNDFQSLGVNETATTTIEYTLTDGDGSTDTAVVTVTVEGVNDAPIPVDPNQPPVVDPNDPSAPPTDPDDPRQPPLDPQNYIPVQSVIDGDPATPTLDLTPYFGDPDANDDVTLSLDPNDLPSGLTFDPLTGIISGTPDNSTSQGGDPLNPGTYVIEVTATDPSGATFTTNVTYLVENLPPVAQDDALTTDEDSPVTANVFDDNGNGVDEDTAPDSDDIYVSAVDGQPAGVGVPVAGSDGGTFTINPDGTVIFDPAGQFETLAVGETAETSITYTITDAEGGTDTATVTVTVTGESDAPLVANPLIDQVNDDGDTVTPVDVSDLFDEPNGDPLTITADGLPEGLTIDPVTGIITGTLPNDASPSGPYQVTLTATNPDGDQVTSQFIWTVNNPAPAAVEDTTTTPVDTPVTINPLTNDVDPDSDDLTVTEVTPPTNGTVTINPDGTLEYTPNAGFNGTDTFSYTISDGQGGTDTANVTVEVTDTPPSGVPSAGPLSPQSGVDGEQIPPIDISTSFNDPDGGPLTFTATDLPPGLEIDPNTGIITGIIDPSASQAGPYNVTITATDPDGNQVSETFPFEISNPAPVAVADAATTTPDTPVTINPLGNDSDPDGDELSVSEIITQPNNGTVVIKPDGTLEYTPNTGFTGTDTFTYRVTDNEGGFDEATITVDVNNTPPLGVPTTTGIPPQTGIDGDPIDFDVSDFFDDPDGGPLTYTITGLPDGLTLDPLTGVVTGTLPNDASVTGPFDIVVTATDPDGNTISTPTTLTVSNPAPTADDDAAETTPSTPVLINVGENDSDPDSDETTIVEGTPPASGVVVVNPDGTILYTPDDGFVGVDTFTYIVDDGQGGTDEATVTVNVTSEPEGPTVTPNVPTQSVTDGEDVPPLDVSVAFFDPDGDALTFVAAGLPTGLAIDPNTGVITGVIDGSASQVGTNPTDAPGVYEVTVTGTDPAGNATRVTVTYVVANIPPTAVDDASTGTEDVIQSGNVLTDPVTGDADTPPDGDPVIVTEVEGQPVVPGTPTTIELTNGTLQLSDDGSWTFTPNGTANTLGDGETVVETVSYTIDDGEGGTDTADLVITIQGVNDPVVVVDPNDPPTDPQDPEYDPVNPPVVDPNGLVDALDLVDGAPMPPLDMSVYFGDAEDDQIIYTATNLPDGVTIDPVTGVISGTPDNDASVDGPYAATVIATDPQGNTAEVPVDINVTNPPPVTIAELPDVESYVQTPFVIPTTQAFNDPDNDVLLYTATGLPDGMTIDPDTGIISGSPAPDTVTGGPNGDGLFIITVTVDDQQGGTTTAVFEHQIRPLPFVAPEPEPPLPEGPTDPGIPGDPPRIPPVITQTVHTMEPLGPINTGLPTESRIIDRAVNGFGDLVPNTELQGPHYIDAIVRHLDDLMDRDRESGADFGAHGDETHPYLGDESYIHVVPGRDCVLFRSVVWEGEVYVEMLDKYGGKTFGDIRDYRVTGPDGVTLPKWINQRADNLVLIDRPANVEAIALEVHVTLRDGTVRTIELDIDLLTGQLDSALPASESASASGSFTDRIAALADEPLQEQSSLLAALKNHTV